MHSEDEVVKMISTFPRVFGDELLFSILGRYQYYEAESSPRDILENVFGTRSLRANIEFPTHLMSLAKSLNHLDMTTEDILMAHTIFPMYEPFMTKSDSDVMKTWMYEDGGHKVKFKIGYIAGSVMKKESLYYCPTCVKESVRNGEEPYFKVVHQMQGIQVCHIHNVVLNPYLISKEEMSVIRYYHMNINLIINEETIKNDSSLLRDISKAFNDLYIGGLQGISINEIKSTYKRKLKELGYLSVNDSVKYEKFVPEMINHFGVDVLKSLESEIETKTEFNWIKNLLRSKNRKVHPLRHILFIIYFFGSIEKFRDYIYKKSRIKKYPCMNPVGGHYKKLVINEGNIKVTADYKTREPVITLTCPKCGFTYSRKESDDIFHVGRVKEFGDVWFHEFDKIIKRDDLSLREKARRMGCDVGTVKKYNEML